MGVFHVFSNCTNGNKLRKPSQLKIDVLQNLSGKNFQTKHTKIIISIQVFLQENHFCLNLNFLNIMLEIRLRYLKIFLIFLKFSLNSKFSLILIIDLGLTLTINFIFLIMKTENNFK